MRKLLVRRALRRLDDMACEDRARHGANAAGHGGDGLDDRLNFGKAGVAAEVAVRADVDADIQSYFKKNDLHVSSRCYIVDDQSMIAMVACGQGLALMPELMFKEGAASAGCQVLQLEPAAKRTIGLACLSRTALSPAAREFVEHARAFARKR